MKLPNYLILASLCLVSSSALAQQPAPSCKELDVKISVSRSNSASLDADIRIVTEDSLQPTIYLLSRNDRQIKEKVNSLTITSVPPGDYVLLIVDEQGQFCPRTMDVTIPIEQE